MVETIEYSLVVLTSMLFAGSGVYLFTDYTQRVGQTENSATFSSIHGWALYLVASGAFLSMASVPVSMEAQMATRIQVDSLLDGISAILNSLVPGLTVTLHYHSWLTNLSVWVDGHEVRAASSSLVAERSLSWWSQPYSLQTDVTYLASLSSGGLRIVEKGVS